MPIRRGQKTGRHAQDQMTRWRPLVFIRDHHGCVARGSGHGECSDMLTLQHRVGRGMGGSSQVGDGPQWFVAMCYRHNALAERDADFRELCEQNGWSLRRSHDAAERVLAQPVKYPDGSWWLLDGTAHRHQVG